MSLFSGYEDHFKSLIELFVANSWCLNYLKCLLFESFLDWLLIWCLTWINFLVLTACRHI